MNATKLQCQQTCVGLDFGISYSMLPCVLVAERDQCHDFIERSQYCNTTLERGPIASTGAGHQEPWQCPGPSVAFPKSSRCLCATAVGASTQSGRDSAHFAKSGTPYRASGRPRQATATHHVRRKRPAAAGEQVSLMKQRCLRQSLK